MTRAERRRKRRLKMRRIRRVLKGKGEFQPFNQFTETDEEAAEYGEKLIRKILSGNVYEDNDWDYWNDPGNKKARAKVDLKEHLASLNDPPEHKADEDFYYERFDDYRWDDFEIYDSADTCEYPWLHGCFDGYCFEDEPEPTFEYGGITYPKPKELSHAWTMGYPGSPDLDLHHQTRGTEGKVEDFRIKS